jgi:hypothetical protein
MKTFKGWLVVGAVGVLAACSAKAAIDVTFDSADSNIGAGLYAFDLSGVPTTPTPTYESQFELYNFDNPTGIQNMLDPLVADSSPTGWSANGPNDINSVRWYFDYETWPTVPGAVDGTFVVQATPNLNGTLNWNFADSGNSEDVSGTATIVATPEPTSVGCLLLGSGILAVIRRFRQNGRG